MTTTPPATQPKVGLLLGNLATGFLPQRLDAIKKLAALDFSSTDIVVALLVTKKRDTDPTAREAAAQALNVPVHQTFWQEHSDVIASKLAEEERVTKTRLGTLSWHQAWSMAVFHPSAKTFEQISLDFGATFKKAFLWMWISNLFVPVIGVAISTILALPPGRIPWYDLAPYPVFCLIQSVAAAIRVAILTLVEMMGIGVWHIVARLFQGKGTYAGLLNAMAAFIAPLTLMLMLIGLASELFAAPFLIWLVIPILVYMLVLYLIAIKTVYQFGWVRAMISYILGSLLLLACVALLLPIITGGDTSINSFYEIIQPSQTAVP